MDAAPTRFQETSVANPQPFCDRHQNLQMVPFTFKYPTGTITGHVCPVPGCNRHLDDQGYFDLVGGKPVRDPRTRVASARAAIMRAIYTKAK